MRREYVINSLSVRVEDIAYDSVRCRMEEITKGARPGESLRVVLAGFSPLVALVSRAAREMGLVQVYFIKDDKTPEYVEVPVE